MPEDKSNRQKIDYSKGSKREAGRLVEGTGSGKQLGQRDYQPVRPIAQPANPVAQAPATDAGSPPPPRSSS